MFAANYPFPPLAKDDAVYDKLAWSLASGEGFTIFNEPVPWRTPGYPAFVSVVYSLAGRDANAIRFSQILLSLLTCMLVYVVGRKVMRDRAAFLAAGIYAVWPAAAGSPSSVLSEANQALLVMLLVYCAERSLADGASRLWFAALGLVLGIATLCRPDYQLLIVPLVAVMWLAASAKRHVLTGVAVMAVVFAATLTPWIVRNYLVFGQYIGLASGSGNVLMVAMYEAEGHFGAALNERMNARYGADFMRRHGRLMTYIDGALPDQDKILRQDFIKFVKTEPLTYLRHSMVRLVQLWQPHSFSHSVGLKRDFSEYRAAREYPELAIKFALLLMDAAFVALGCLGALFAARHWRRYAIPLLLVAYISVVYGLANGYARYRIPVLPVLALFAACAVEWLTAMYEASKSPRAPRGPNDLTSPAPMPAVE